MTPGSPLQGSRSPFLINRRVDQSPNDEGEDASGSDPSSDVANGSSKLCREKPNRDDS